MPVALLGSGLLRSSVGVSMTRRGGMHKAERI
jgi:hypothetical protein